jgi:hypothetical protein
MRSLYLLLVTVAVGCFAIAGYLYVSHQPTPTLPEFVIEPTAVDLGWVPSGEHDFVIRVANPAGVPRRIVGLAEG